MPPLPAVPGVIKFVIEGDTPANAWANVLHWSYSGTAPTPGDLNSFCESLYTAWNTNIMPNVVTTAHLLEVNAVDLSSDLGASGVWSASAAGTGADVETSGNLAVLVTKTIPRRYRGGHPRTYVLAGAPADLATASTWNSTLVNAITAAYGEVQTAMIGLTHGATTILTEVCVSYMESVGTPPVATRRAVPLVLTVNSAIAQARIGSQRRRIGR